jgi:hypothetical protein
VGKKVLSQEREKQRGGKSPLILQCDIMEMHTFDMTAAILGISAILLGKYPGTHPKPKRTNRGIKKISQAWYMELLMPELFLN